MARLKISELRNRLSDYEPVPIMGMCPNLGIGPVFPLWECVPTWDQVPILGEFPKLGIWMLKQICQGMWPPIPVFIAENKKGNCI